MTDPAILVKLPDWVRAELQRTPQAAALGAVRTGAHLQATAAHYDARRKHIVVDLANGSQFAFPPALAQGLEQARAADLAQIEITPLGTGLHWPRLDAPARRLRRTQHVTGQGPGRPRQRRQRRAAAQGGGVSPARGMVGWVD